MNTSLSNQWVFITGASAGFGAEGARHFAREGANVVLGARRVERLEQVAADCEKAGAASAHFHELDVACTESVNAFVDWLKGLTPKLDVLVNNAGGAHGMDTVAGGKDADWEAMVQSNFLGLMRVTRACLPLMVENPGSTIINIGSVIGTMGNAGQANYAAAKAGLAGFTKALAKEVGSRGITANLVAPGFIDTDITSALPEEAVSAVLAQVPLQRLGQPADVAPLVAFLAGEGGTYITGQVIHVDGGLVMS